AAAVRAASGPPRSGRARRRSDPALRRALARRHAERSLHEEADERPPRPPRGRLVVALAPEAERLEAPLRGELHHRPEDAIERSPDEAVADAVIEDGLEERPVASPLVEPEPAPPHDERLPVARAELERRALERHVLEVAARALDGHAEAQARRVAHLLEAARVRLGEILDLVEADVPADVERRVLGPLPDPVDRGVEERLDDDAAPPRILGEEIRKIMQEGDERRDAHDVHEPAEQRR